MQRREFGPVVAAKKAGVVHTVQPESNTAQRNKGQCLNGPITGQDNTDVMLAWSAKHYELQLQTGSPPKIFAPDYTALPRKIVG